MNKGKGWPIGSRCGKSEDMDEANSKLSWLEVTDRIARDIRSGALPPGLWLKQIDLQTRYNATRPEVRRSLDLLAQKRVVMHIPNRGYRVHEPDGRQTEQVRDVRIILEVAAADSIVALADEAALLRLEGLARRFDDLLDAGALLEQYEVNLEFHRELLGLCDNRELVGLVAELRTRASPAPAGQWRSRARVAKSAREHHAMIEAIRRRDAAALKRVIELHIRQPGEPDGN
ncbi:GntR family transcriptional regulator [Faunimonas pinastri]|uniref:GntR family transcriptional regulator n=1 Tax=Faunimonas pinastri TaxID=1855383 RepID=UPI001EE9C2CE|nr:GntR family transcriptional regulator [Faunimonas pinastri]